jgi:ABC-type metal ion transport system substrate-binding protein
MKKLMLLLIVSFTLAFTANAQTEVKVKKTSTPIQKVHNTFSKRKHYKGYKVKTKTPYRKTKKTVNNKTGEVEIKSN